MKKAGSKMEHQGIKIEFIGQIGKLNHLSFFPSEKEVLCMSVRHDCYQRQIVLFPYKTKIFFRTILWQRKSPWVYLPCQRTCSARGDHRKHNLWVWVSTGWKAIWVLHRCQCEATVRWFKTQWIDAVGSDWLKMRDGYFFIFILCLLWYLFINRYFLRVTIVKRLSDSVKEQDIIVHTLSQYPEMNSSIKMEVGIEDCLHIEFEYNKSK